ncbi:MAG: hypothetical protein KA314_04560 [Chloroflexi bacterium]|nr:hypothetical protein [Chloroflexota bacterium]
MKTNKHTVTRTTSNGKKIEVTIERGTWTEEVHLDGSPTGTYETYTIDRTSIKMMDTTGKILASDSSVKPMSYGKIHYAKDYAKAVSLGCVGMVGNAYIKQATMDLISSAIAEAEAGAPKTQEQIDIEVAKAAAQKAYDGWYNSPEEGARRKFAREMGRTNSDY